MNVLHAVASLNREDGGGVNVAIELTQFLAKKGIDVTIFAPAVSESAGVRHANGVRIKYFARGYLAKFWSGYSRPLADALKRESAEYDLIHTHGLWYFPQYAAYQAAKISKKPVLATIHGELSATALAHRALKKKIFSALIQKKILRNAAAIHAVSEKEARDIAEFVAHPRIVVVPNGINVGEFAGPADIEWIRKTYPQLAGKKVILFMGRIHAAKGLAVLAQAFARMAKKRNDLRLLIVGPDNWGYRVRLEKLLQHLGVMDQVIFTGMLVGLEKRAAWGAADIFALPSYSEGFSIATLEAMACGLPVVISRHCNFPEVEKARVGRIVDTDVEALSGSLMELLENPGLCQAMGARGRNLVREKYSWDAIAGRMIAVYDKIIEQGKRQQ